MSADVRILVVEDEAAAARLLARGLREQSFAVDIAPDGRAAMEKILDNTYDLVVLDRMLPGVDGMRVCQEIRRMGLNTPVLMLTARDGVNDRIAGLDSGADDYLTKPYDFGELLARIRALLRRGPTLEDPLIAIADLEIDTRTHRVRRGGESIELTAKEYALLELMARRADEVISREEIAEHVWDEDYDPFSNLIEVYIQRLRRKIDQGREPKLLHTRRGEGYRLGIERP
jgi:DNA-binding response OmpR family regulator